MNCSDVQDRFSLRFDGDLTESDQRAIDGHCASCSSCEAAWKNFMQATERLRSTGVNPVSDDYVDSIVTAVLGTHSELAAASEVRKAGWKPLLSHASALLAGAAAMLLILRPGANLPQEPVQERVADTTPAMAWNLNHGTGTLTRGPESFIRNMGALDLVSGDRLTVTPGSELQFTGSDGEVIRIGVLPVVALKPRIEIVEWVELVEVPGPAANTENLERAMLFAGNSLLALRERLEALSVPMATTEAPMDNALTAARALEPQPDAEPPRRRPESRPSAFPETLVVERRGATLHLETRGTMDEVVPALISHLDDSDGAVSALVQQHLEDIYYERTGTAWARNALELEQASRSSNFGWRRWAGAQKSNLADVSQAERWSAWWASEQVSLASIGN